MARKSIYSFSYTAASLRLNEMIKVANTLLNEGKADLTMVKENGIAFSSTKTSTSIREFREIKNRLKKLTPKQLDIIANGDLNSQKQIGFLSMCKHYAIIKDFTIEVLRDKVLVFNYQINESDFKTFIESKMLLHPELEQFSDSTLKKAKQVLFLILEQSGIINSSKEKLIQPQIVQTDVIKSIIDDDPVWLKIFMISDLDIKQLKKQHG